MANYLIIAGTSDIGFATAKKLLAAGHHIFITGREQTKTVSVAEKLNVPFALVEATDFSAVDKAFQQAKEKMTSLQGVVNCAGSLFLKAAHLTTRDEFQEVIAANLTTAFATVSAAGKHLNKEGGSVVLLSTAAALIGVSSHEAIAAAKAGIIGLTLAAAATYAANKLRFNAIAPGLVETNLTTKLTANSLSRKASEAMHALGRIGTREDIAAAIVFFLTPENDWITGQILAVDGGLSRIHPKVKM